MPDTHVLEDVELQGQRVLASEGNSDQPHIIVVGNEKGGAGKSTVAMHLSVVLMRMGWHVGVIDMDLRQRSLSRYLSNRANWLSETGVSLPMPEMTHLDLSLLRHLDQAEEEEMELFQDSLKKLNSCQFLVIDTPGGTTHLSRAAHGMADTLITPMNDSFIDFDLLGEIDPKTMKVMRPGFYSEMVWESRKNRALSTRRQIDWIVMRNRMSMLGTRNKQRVGNSLEHLSRRIGFRIAPGMSERVIFRELFPSGLTLLDMDESPSGFTLSHVAARQELRDLLMVLKLPGLEGQKIPF